MTSTRRRVPAHTRPDINRRIRNETERKIRFYEQHRDLIPARLRELDEEWDIERAIEANASALAFTGVAAGILTDDRRWFVLPVVVTAFLFQHAIQGWCPPIPILRRLGFRTSYEIEEERQALKALRGDFETISRSVDKPAAALGAATAS
jgi:hypothetical protein